MGFEPTTTSLGSPLASYSMKHAWTQGATGTQQYQGIPVTARYRPQQRDTGATVTKTGKYRWNRDWNRNKKTQAKKYSSLLTMETTHRPCSAGGGPVWGPPRPAI